MQRCRPQTLKAFKLERVPTLLPHLKPMLAVQEGCKVWLFCKGCARNMRNHKVPPTADAPYGNIPFPVPIRPPCFEGL
jgi:hypothetical protein